MSDLIPINLPTSTPARARAADQSARRSGAPAEAHSSRPADRLELSDHAVLLSRLRELPAVRRGLVTKVRAQIDAGAYDTPARVEQAVSALVRDVAGEG